VRDRERARVRDRERETERESERQREEVEGEERMNNTGPHGGARDTFLFCLLKNYVDI
jgi:hypothetical protein